MKKKIIQLLREPGISRLVKIFLAIIAIYLVTIIWKWKQIPPQVPLFYSLPRSTDQLVIFWQLLLLPFFSLLFFCVNFLIAALLYPAEKLAYTLLITIGTVISLLLLITFIKIVFLVS